MFLRPSFLILPLFFAAACSRGVRPEPPDAWVDQPTGGTGGRNSEGAGLCTNRFFPQASDALDGKGNPRFGESDVLILFDGSESTGIACGNGTRASVMADTLKTLVDDYQGRIAFGLMLFPYAAWCGAEESPGCCVGAPSVFWSLQMGATIRAALDSRPPPQGSSPMAQALQMAGSVFRPRPNRHENRLVLLATDGQPGCPLGLGDAAASSSACQEAVRAIQDLGQMEPPVRTLVLGPGPGDLAGKTDCLRALSEAAANVNKARDASMMKTGFTVDDVDSLREALESTFDVYDVAKPSCEIVLTPPPVSNSRISVSVDGTVIPENDDYGWKRFISNRVVDGGTETTHTITLRGEYCERLKQFRYNKVEVKYDCRNIIVRHGGPSQGRRLYCKT